MNKKIVDLDAFLRETRRKPISLKLYDEEFEIPASIPMAFGLAQVQFSEIDDPDAKDILDLELTMLTSLFGADRVNMWIAEGASRQDMNAILGHVVSLINNRVEDEGGTEVEMGKETQ